jgi:tetratricopeptide (TPR) repeat protein
MSSYSIRLPFLLLIPWFLVTNPIFADELTPSPLAAACIEQAETWIAQGESHRAFVSLHSFIETHPDEISVYLRFLEQCCTWQRWEIGLTTIFAAWEQEIHHPGLYTAAIQLAQQKNDSALTQQVIDQATNRYPMEPDLIKAEASFYKSRGEYDRAIRALQRGIILQPNQPEFYIEVMLIYLEQGYYEQAAAILQTRHAFSPTDFSTNFYRGYLAYIQGDFQQALDIWQQMKERHPRSTFVYPYIGLTWLQLGNETEAMPYFISLLQDEQRRLDGLLYLGQAYEFLKEYSLALDFYHQAQDLEPGNVSPYLKIGNVYLALDEYKMALAAYNQVLMRDPDNLTAAVNIGWTYHRMGKDQFALDYYLSWLQQHVHGDGYMYSNIGLIYAYLGAFEESWEYLQRGKKHGERMYTRLYEVVWYGLQGDEAFALSVIKQVLDTAPPTTFNLESDLLKEPAFQAYMALPTFQDIIAHHFE